MEKIWAKGETTFRTEILTEDVLRGGKMRDLTHGKIKGGCRLVREFSFSKAPVFPDSDKEYFVFPGFCDVHVHLREPGFFYKESIRTGTMAAARGGFTAVCAMPNLDPVPDSRENLLKEIGIIARDAVINVYPYAALTVGEKGLVAADLEGTSDLCVAYSDDGKGVQRRDTMLSLMERAEKLGKIVAAHCEDESLLRGGYIHDGIYAKTHGHKGICSESEYLQIERDLALAEETGVKYHVCHVSAKESVELIRKAKKRGADVTCETAPHYLVLDENDLREEGRFKMNPPLRSEKDRLALIEGIKDGTIDMIATDHAPHSAEEKSRGLSGSAFGIVGLETAFPVLYTELVMKGVITADRLIGLMAVEPRRRFGIPFGKSQENFITLSSGENVGDFSVWELGEEYEIDPEEFLSKGRATPFEGRRVFGRNIATFVNGKEVYSSAEKGR